MDPWVAAQLFLEKIPIAAITGIKVKLFGSLSKTAKGQGTDIAVQLGLSGFDAKTIAVDKIDEYILDINQNEALMVNSVKLIAFDSALDIVFNNEKLPFHPNGMICVAQFEDNSTIEETYYSIGGGFVTQEGELATNHEDVKFPFPIASEKDLLKHMSSEGLGIYDLVYGNELVLKTAKEIDANINEFWDAMQTSIYNGYHKNGILPGRLNVVRRAFNINIDLIEDRKYSNTEEWIAAIKTCNHSFSNITK